MYCSKCGKQNLDNAKFCASCGTMFTDAPNSQSATPPPQYSTATPTAAPGAPSATDVSPKSKITAALLAFFLGTLGIHRFYAGKVGTAVVMLILTIIGWVTLFFVVGIFIIWAIEIWAFIDFIIILVGKFKDKNGLYITK